MSTQDPPFVDIPELAETFADSVRFIGFDGQTWRIEFVTTRIQAGEIKLGATTIPAKQYPTCRLVLPAGAGLDLLNKLNQTADALEKQGILKKNAPPQMPFVMPEQKTPH